MRFINNSSLTDSLVTCSFGVSTDGVDYNSHKNKTPPSNTTSSFKITIPFQYIPNLLSYDIQFGCIAFSIIFKLVKAIIESLDVHLI